MWDRSPAKLKAISSPQPRGEAIVHGLMRESCCPGMCHQGSSPRLSSLGGPAPSCLQPRVCGRQEVRALAGAKGPGLGPCQKGRPGRGRQSVKHSETQIWPTTDSRDKDNKATSSLVLMSGLSQTCGQHFREGQPGFCNNQDAKLGVPDTGGSVEV